MCTGYWRLGGLCPTGDVLPTPQEALDAAVDAIPQELATVWRDWTGRLYRPHFQGGVRLDVCIGDECTLSAWVVGHPGGHIDRVWDHPIVWRCGVVQHDAHRTKDVAHADIVRHVAFFERNRFDGAACVAYLREQVMN